MKKTKSWKEFVKEKFVNDQTDGTEEKERDEIINNLDQINWNVDSELVIKFLTIPTAKNYTALRKQLESCNKAWMTKFLEHDGLEVMFSGMRQMSERSYIQFADAVLQLELVRCIKAVINSKVGMDFVTTHGDMVYKLALGMTFFCLLYECQNRVKWLNCTREKYVICRLILLSPSRAFSFQQFTVSNNS